MTTLFVFTLQIWTTQWDHTVCTLYSLVEGLRSVAPSALCRLEGCSVRWDELCFCENLGFGAGLGIRAFDCSLFALSLLSIFKKEWLWAIRSRHFLKKCNLEQIALIARYKIATVSESLWFLLKQWYQCFARDSNELLSKNERFAKKHLFLYVFDNFPPLLCQKSKSLPGALHSIALF